MDRQARIVAGKVENMTDELKELLVLAAKAAGIALSPFQCREADSLYLLDSTHWNPAENDGDMARMETALRLDGPHWISEKTGPFGVWYRVGIENYGEAIAGHPNPGAARRMAALRAAAEVGRRMKP
jgi:hypothetical protein